MTAVVTAWAALAVLTVGATDRAWIGGAGDGLFSSPGNWEPEGTPQTGDALTVDPAVGVSALTVENDIEGLSVGKLTIGADGGDATRKVTVNGKQIVISPAKAWCVSYINYCSVEMNAGLKFNKSDFVHFNGAYNVFNGDVVGADGVRIKMFSADSRVLKELSFNGEVRFDPQNSALNLACGENGYGVHVYFNGKVTCGSVENSLETNPTTLHFTAAENAVGTIAYNANAIYFDAEDGLSAGTVISYKSAYSQQYIWTGYCYMKSGSTQTFNRLSGTYASSDSRQKLCVSPAGGNATMILKGTADDSTGYMLTDGLSLVWDPQGGAYTQTFSGRASTTTGSILVKGGCVQMQGTATSFTNVPQIVVSTNAQFALDGTAAGALSGLTRLILRSGARFSVTAGTASPFAPAGLTTFMAADAKFVIPAETTVAAGTVLVDGVPLAAGSYTGTGGTSGKVIGQIEGTGTLVVSEASGAWWSGAEDLTWDKTANWNGGALPSDSLPARIARYGTYEIAAAAATLPAALDARIDNVSDGMSTLTLSGTKSFDGAKLALVGNGTLKIAAGADLAFASSSIAVGDGCSLKMAGGKMTVNDRASLPVCTAGGEIELDGDAELAINFGWCNVLKTGTFRMKGSAKLHSPIVSSSARTYFSPAAAGETCAVTFEGDSRFNNGNDGLGAMFVLNKEVSGGKTVMTVGGTARAYCGYSLDVAYGNGTAAELAIRDSGYVQQRYYGVKVGTKATDVSSPSRGVLRISGGTLEHYVETKASGNQRCGLVVGDGGGAEAAGYANYGELYLSGNGRLSNGNGKNRYEVLLVGVGSGNGKVVQSGGKCDHNSYSPVVVGFRGGCGSYELTGGTLGAGNADLYVGGCTTGALECTYANLPTEKPGLGSFTLGGGTSTVNRVFISKEGVGEMTVTGGLMTVKGDFELCDCEVAGESHAAKLAFKVGADATCGLIDVGGAFKVGEDSKLEIDLGGYAGRRITLLKAASVTGAFKPENVTIVSRVKGDPTVRLQNGRLTVSINRGFLMILR